MTPRSIVARTENPGKGAVGVLVRYGTRIGTLTQIEHGKALVLFDDGPWIVQVRLLKLYPSHEILLDKCYGQSPWSWCIDIVGGKLALKRSGRPKGSGRPAAFQTLGRSESGPPL